MPNQFLPDDAAIDDLLRGPNGLVVRHVKGFAENVVDAARVNAAPHGPDSHGELADSIQVIETVGVDGLTYRVSADPIDHKNGFGYGLVAHEGHGVILPKEGGIGTLDFFWFAENRYVRLPIVHETPGNPYLTDALKEVNDATADGFRLEPGTAEL